MKSSFLTLFALVSVPLFALNAASQEQRASDPFNELLEPAHDSERREAAAELIAQASNERIRELKAHPHATIALHAAWEQVRRTVRIKPEYEDEHPEPIKIDRRALQRFLCFVEGRLRVPLPKWWESRLAEAYIYPNDAAVLWFKRKETRKPYSKAGNGIYAPNQFAGKVLPDGDLELRERGLADGTCRIPSRLLEEAKRRYMPSVFGIHLTASIDAKRCVFGFHGAFARGFTLQCIDRESSEILWSAEVFGYFSGGSTGVGHTHWVAMRQACETVYLFATDGGRVYIEAFSVKDGTNLIRFCTDYYWWE